MDAKAEWLCGYAAQNHLHVLKVVKETTYLPDFRGVCILGAHREHPSAKVVLADPFDAVALREWTADQFAVLVVQPRRAAVTRQRIVTLVHGTFSPSAAWTQTNSDFSNELRKHLPGVVIRRFQWSGNNSPSARHLASLELLCYLETISNEFCGCEHYIVAHSHGGSVALHCLQNVELQPHVAGVICMNTPFLKYAPRDLTPLIATAGATLGIIAMYMIGAAFGPFVGLFLGGALLLLASSFALSFADVWKKDASRWISRLGTGAPVVPLFWVRNQDEVPTYLRTIATTTALPGFVWQIAGGVAAVLAKGTLIVLLLIMVFAVVRFVVTGKISIIPGVKEIAEFYEGMMISALTIIFVAPWAMLVVLFASLLRRWLAFGSLGFADLFISVKTSSEGPVGSKRDELSVRDSKGCWHGILHFQHSLLHDNPIVVAKIADWIGAHPSQTAFR